MAEFFWGPTQDEIEIEGVGKSITSLHLLTGRDVQPDGPGGNRWPFR